MFLIPFTTNFHSAAEILQCHWLGSIGTFWCSHHLIREVRYGLPDFARFCQTVAMKRPFITACTHLVFRPSIVSGPLLSCYYSTPLSMASNNIKNTLFKNWMDIVRICECYFICFISDFGKKITGNSPKNTNSELKPRSLNDMVYDMIIKAW